VVGWTCELAPDERVSVAAAEARLRRENARLKNALLERGIPLPDGVAAEPALPAASPPGAPAAGPPAAEAPSAVAPPPVAAVPPSPPRREGESARPPRDPDFDRAMDAMEKVWRRMVEMVVSMQREMQKQN
jgi:hypothetical protein